LCFNFLLVPPYLEVGSETDQKCPKKSDTDPKKLISDQRHWYKTG